MEKDRNQTISLICGIKNKMKKKTNKNSETDTKRVVTRGGGAGERTKRVKGVRHRAKGGDWTSGGEHPMSYTGIVIKLPP